MMDKIEAIGAMIHQSQEGEWSAGLLGASIKVSRGSGVGIHSLLVEARLEEIERRILAMEARLSGENGG